MSEGKRGGGGGGRQPSRQTSTERENDRALEKQRRRMRERESAREREGILHDAASVRTAQALTHTSLAPHPPCPLPSPPRSRLVWVHQR